MKALRLAARANLKVIDWLRERVFPFETCKMGYPSLGAEYCENLDLNTAMFHKISRDKSQWGSGGGWRLFPKKSSFN